MNLAEFVTLGFMSCPNLIYLLTKLITDGEFDTVLVRYEVGVLEGDILASLQNKDELNVKWMVETSKKTRRIRCSPAGEYGNNVVINFMSFESLLHRDTRPRHCFFESQLYVVYNYGDHVEAKLHKIRKLLIFTIPGTVVIFHNLKAKETMEAFFLCTDNVNIRLSQPLHTDVFSLQFLRTYRKLILKFPSQIPEGEIEQMHKSIQNEIFLGNFVTNRLKIPSTVALNKQVSLNGSIAYANFLERTNQTIYYDELKNYHIEKKQYPARYKLIKIVFIFSTSNKFLLYSSDYVALNTIILPHFYGHKGKILTGNYIEYVAIIVQTRKNANTNALIGVYFYMLVWWSPSIVLCSLVLLLIRCVKSQLRTRSISNTIFDVYSMHFTGTALRSISRAENILFIFLSIHVLFFNIQFIGLLTEQFTIPNDGRIQTAAELYNSNMPHSFEFDTFMGVRVNYTVKNKKIVTTYDPSFFELAQTKSEDFYFVVSRKRANLYVNNFPPANHPLRGRDIYILNEPIGGQFKKKIFIRSN